jgi:hypothetical protein
VPVPTGTCCWASTSTGHTSSSERSPAAAKGIKPGWVRVNFNYFISDVVADYIIAAVTFVARHGWKLVCEYRFDPATGLWRHRQGLVEPPLRLSQLRYDDEGTLSYLPHRDRAPESDLARYLQQAASIVASVGGDDVDDSQGSVSANFDALRWFDLPASCLVNYPCSGTARESVP